MAGLNFSSSRTQMFIFGTKTSKEGWRKSESQISMHWVCMIHLVKQMLLGSSMSLCSKHPLFTSLECEPAIPHFLELVLHQCTDARSTSCPLTSDNVTGQCQWVSYTCGQCLLSLKHSAVLLEFYWGYKVIMIKTNQFKTLELYYCVLTAVW